MKKIRYAVVGTGWISQIAFMPSIAQTGNSEITAIVSGNRANAEKLASFYGIEHIYAYDQYDEMLNSGHVDAVYIALPNSLHADYAIRAAKAGVHALVEKPLAVTAAECEAMIAAAGKAGVKLMTAYRLHTEPGTLEAIDIIRRGEIGEPRLFSSVFSFPVAAGNHRLKAEHWGGPLQDIGVYCVNAMRHLLGAEPTEVIAAIAARPGDARFTEVEEMVSATLRFPQERIAQFVASFGGDEVPCAPYATFGTPALAEAVRATIPGHAACLLANHGMIVHGATPEAGLAAALLLETLARQYLLARAAGAVRLLTAAEMDAARERFKTY